MKNIITSFSNFLNEQLNNKDVDVYMMGDTKREMFIFLVKDDIGIGGIYSGISPVDSEDQFSAMKVGISDPYKGKGYGSILYLSTLSLLKDKGLSPHRKVESTRPDAVRVWKKLNDKPYIKRIKLDNKINNNDLLDSKYILTDKSIIEKYTKNIKKISDDAFDESNIYAKQSWDIVNKHMDN